MHNYKKKLLTEFVRQALAADALLCEISLGLSHGTINYTAIVLDEQSHMKLASLAPAGWKVYAHHMTMINPPNMKRRLPARWLGHEIVFTVIGIAGGTPEKPVMTALVDLGDMPLPMKGPAYPHITIATDPSAGGKPAMSNTEFVPTFGHGPDQFRRIDPIEVRGTIEEVMK